MDELRKRIQIGVMGPESENLPKGKRLRSKMLEAAERIGELIAKNNAVLFTGGCDGVMKYAAKGAKRFGGTTVGVPGSTRGTSNRYTDIEIITAIDVGSFIFSGLLSCDALIFLPGGSGTLAELCLAYRNRKPCIVVNGYSKQYDAYSGKYLDDSKKIKMLGADSPEEAVTLAFKEATQYAKKYSGMRLP